MSSVSAGSNETVVVVVLPVSIEGLVILREMLVMSLVKLSLPPGISHSLNAKRITQLTKPRTISNIRRLALVVLATLPPAVRYWMPQIEIPMSARMPMPIDIISMMRRRMCQMPASPPPSHSIILVLTPLQVAAKVGRVIIEVIANVINSIRIGLKNFFIYRYYNIIREFCERSWCRRFRRL